MLPHFEETKGCPIEEYKDCRIIYVPKLRRYVVHIFGGPDYELETIDKAREFVKELEGSIE